MTRFAAKSPNPRSSLTRRGFLGTALGAVPAAALLGQDARPQAPAQAAAPSRIKEYRTLGRTGFKVSDIAFGAGPLNNANVLAAALDRGMNYIDTAEHYVNGNSERAIGQALKGRDRSKVFLTTKLNMVYDKRIDKAALRDRFMKCLERLGTDYADCLMIHLCPLALVKHEPYHELIKELKAEGKARFSGLSSHGADYSLSGRIDDPVETVIMAAAEDGRFDVVLCTYNYLKDEAGDRMLKACAAKNMGVTLMKMNPALTNAEEAEMLTRQRERYKSQGKDLPEALVKLAQVSAERTAATEAFLKKHGLAGPEQSRDAALRYCLNRPEVHCVCPSINSFEQLDSYIAISGTKFEAREAEMLADCRETLGGTTCRIGCGECQPACPNGVPVAAIMRYDYYFRIVQREKAAMTDYAALAGVDAAACAACTGPCEAACPHGVPIQGKLVLAHERLTLP
ncbi:MAG: aldo/keto reductase [Candidatus Aminicenantes bacterium]|nr:aldo/keto reductase [Candidatus Aminicenantes bacterium]